MKERPLFARFYERLSLSMDRVEREHRREVAGGAAGRVLEVGVGNGLNLEEYRNASFVVGLEPQPAMLSRAAPRAREAPSPVALVRGLVDSLPFPDGAFDAVVCSLVLCSVPDQRRAVGEIRRVLRPGGELRFWEHVRSRSRWAALFQDVATPLWRPIAGGCSVNRDTVAALRSAGFEVRGRGFPLGPPSPARPHVLGVARAPA